MKRVGVVLVTILAATLPAHADPEIEASGFVGVRHFGHDTHLGRAFAADPFPATQPDVGLRFTGILLDHILGGDTRFSLGLEGELAMTQAFTQGGADRNGPSYWAPVFGYRGQVLLGLGDSRLRAHVVGGMGGESTRSSPMVKTETDMQVFYGVGFGVTVGDVGMLRVDGRQGWMPDEHDAWTSVFEVQLGLSRTWGKPKRPAPVTLEITDTTAPPPLVPVDVPVTPPAPPPTVAADADHDGVADAHDKCPRDAEDKDGFQDEDGCPDLDNDTDGIADAYDRCPMQAETKNGFKDEDGCPDDVPAEVTTALAAVATVKFEGQRARVSPQAITALQPLLDVMQSTMAIRIKLVAHAEKDDAASKELARRRADAVKWHIVDQGIIAADRIETEVWPVPTRGPVIEAVLVGSP